MNPLEPKFYAAITKTDPSQHMVYGYASTEALDSQGEIVKKDALKAALSDYMRFANIREMHQPKAVGKTKQASLDAKGLYIGVKVVDKDAWEKVEEGVYNGFSIGGHVGTMVDNEITALSLSEISLVDRPANPEAVFDVWKRDTTVEKKTFSDDDRKQLASEGKAMPDGSFPIETAQDVENAVHDWGRAGSKDSVKQHIIARAKALKATDKLPADWGGSTKTDAKAEVVDMKKGAGDAASIAYKITCLEDMLAQETLEGDEPTIAALKTAIQALKEAVASEIMEDDEDDDGDVMMYADNPSDILKIVDKKVKETTMPTDEEIDSMLKAQNITIMPGTHNMAKFEIAGLIVKEVERQMEKQQQLDDIKKKANEVLNDADVKTATSVKEKLEFRKILDLVATAEEQMKKGSFGGKTSTATDTDSDAHRGTITDVVVPDAAESDPGGNPAQSQDLVSLQRVVALLSEKGLGGALTPDEQALLRNGVSGGSEVTSANQMSDNQNQMSEAIEENNGVINMNEEITNLKKVHAEENKTLLAKFTDLEEKYEALAKTAMPIKIKTHIVEKNGVSEADDKNGSLEKAEARAEVLHNLMKADPNNLTYHDEAKNLSAHIMKLRREVNE